MAVATETVEQQSAAPRTRIFLPRKDSSTGPLVEIRSGGSVIVYDPTNLDAIPEEYRGDGWDEWKWSHAGTGG